MTWRWHSKGLRRGGYEEIRGNERDSVFEDSVFNSVNFHITSFFFANAFFFSFSKVSARGDVAEVPQPGGLSTLLGCLMFVVAVFRLAWLIFGTVEIFKTTPDACHHYYVPTVVYVLTQWSLIGLVVLVTCCGT